MSMKQAMALILSASMLVACAGNAKQPKGAVSLSPDQLGAMISESQDSLQTQDTAVD